MLKTLKDEYTYTCVSLNSSHLFLWVFFFVSFFSQPMKSSRDLTYKDFFDPVDDNEDLADNDVEDGQEEEAESDTEEQNEEGISE